MGRDAELDAERRRAALRRRLSRGSAVPVEEFRPLNVGWDLGRRPGSAEAVPAANKRQTKRPGVLRITGPLFSGGSASRNPPYCWITATAASAVPGFFPRTAP